VGGSEPAGFGPIARQWEPRRSLYGTRDASWQRSRQPVPPKDFDPRYNCAGHPDLWSETPLRGDEPIEILGATPEGAWRFRLPYYAPAFHVTIDGEEETYDTHLDTILIDIEDTDERIVELSWRCCVRLPHKSERLEKIIITNAVKLGDEHYEEN
jgi:hypothetical protein